MIQKFRKKPVVIEAVQWDGRNWDEVHTFMQEFYGYKPYSLYLNYGFHDNRLKIKCDFSGGLDFGDSDTLFEGGCKDINTFRYICKLLNIN